MPHDTFPARTSALGLAWAALALSGAPACAQTTLMPSIDLTAVPSTVAVGQTMDVVMTATNTSGATLDPSKYPGLGIRIPLTLKGTIVVLAKPAWNCRWSSVLTDRVYYCAWPNPAPAGSQATIRLAITPSLAGSFTLSGHARYGLSTSNAFASTTVTAR